MTHARSTLATLARWRFRIALRALSHQMYRTLEGRLALLVLVLAAPSLWHLGAGGGELARAPLDEDARIGALVIAHIAITLCFLSAVPAHLLRALVLKRREEPLLAHPWALPELSVFQVGTAILGTSLYLWIFFYLFLGRLLLEGSVRPWLTGFTHGIAGLAYLFVLGTVVAWGARKLVLGPRLAHRAKFLQRLLVVPFLLSYPLFILAPTLLSRRAPGALSSVGVAAPGSLFLLQAPLAVVWAASERSWWSLLGWAGTLIAGSALSAWALWCWRRSAPRELSLDLDLERAPRVRGLFARRPLAPRIGAASSRPVHLFWLKDVVVPGLREPAGFLRTHATAALALAVLGFLLAQARAQGQLDESGVTSILTGALLTAVGWTAMSSTLGGLGTEGPHLWLLRPILGPLHLFRIKLAVGCGAAVLHSVLVAVWASLAALGWGLPRDPFWMILGIGVVAAAVFGSLGSAVGFLLPDPGRRSPWIPGASFLAQLSFAFLAGCAVALVVSGRYLLETDVLSAAGFAGFVTAVIAPLLVLSGAFAGWGIHRMARVEP